MVIILKLGELSLPTHRIVHVARINASDWRKKQKKVSDWIFGEICVTSFHPKLVRCYSKTFVSPSNFSILLSPY